MNIPTYLGKLREAGFTTSLLWSHPHTKATRVDCHAIYAPNGHLLTSLVLTEFDGGGVVVYFCAEHNTAEEDIADLKGLWAKQIQRKESAQRSRAKARAVQHPTGGMVD